MLAIATPFAVASVHGFWYVVAQIYRYILGYLDNAFLFHYVVSLFLHF